MRDQGILWLLLALAVLLVRPTSSFCHYAQRSSSTKCRIFFPTSMNSQSDGDALDLRKYQSRNLLLEEAVKTLRQRLEMATETAQDVEILQRRAEDAESLAVELEAQVESERKRSERIRIGWQSELLRVSERAAEAAEDVEQARRELSEARLDNEALTSRVHALEGLLRESEDRAGRSQGVTAGRNEVRREAEAAQAERARYDDAKIRSLERDYAASRAEATVLEDQLKALRTSTGSARELAAQESIATELQAQRRVLERQAEFIETLVRDLTELKARGSGERGRGGDAARTPWSLPEGDASRVFSFVSEQQEQERERSESRERASEQPQQDSAEQPGVEISTKEIIVGGEPYLIDEDNNLYSVSDHTFVRRLGVTVNDSPPSPKASSKRERLVRASGVVGERVGRLVNMATVTARGRLGRVGQSIRTIGQWIVGWDDLQSSDDDAGERGEEDTWARRDGLAPPLRGPVVDTQLEDDDDEDGNGVSMGAAKKDFVDVASPIALSD